MSKSLKSLRNECGGLYEICMKQKRRVGMEDFRKLVRGQLCRALETMNNNSKRRLSIEKLMLSNCGAGEDSWESLGQQGDWTNQSWRKSTEYSLEELMLKLQYFGYLMQTANSLEKILMLGKTEGKRRKGRQRLRWLNSITESMDINMSKLQETVKDRGSLCAAAHRITSVGDNLVTEQQQQQNYII